MSNGRFGNDYYPRPDTGRPVANGKLFFGIVDTDPEVNSIPVYATLEDSTVVEIPQPVYLSPGGVPVYQNSYVKLTVLSNYSLKVKDANDVSLYYFPNMILSDNSPGPQGFQGHQGYQGHQGSIGNQGPQGSMGVQGPQGVTGNQGAQGDIGSQGYQGFQGTTGAQGPQGVQGNQGYQGDDGIQGAQGVTGAQGAQGNQGFQGADGIQGAQGVTGAQGVQGNQGFQGADGIQGAQGVTGAQGVQGNQGAQGDIGSQGYQGSQGATGSQGGDGLSIMWQGTYAGGTTYDQGDGISFNGSLYVSLIGSNTGNQPDTSPSQWEVFAGAQGPQGVTGATGAQGPQGNIGSQGAAGPQGTQGATGPQGVQGNVGSQGAAGPQGTQGATGPQGVQGNVGSQGAVGPQGTQGATGPQGVQGNVGSQGAIGPQGNQGYQGATGAQGLIGPQGNIGSQGAIGSQGYQGSQGSQGFAGPQGAQGNIGATLVDNILVGTGGLIKIGTGTKDSNLTGIVLDSTEIVGQIAGVDTFYLKSDGTGYFSQYVNTDINGFTGFTAGVNAVVTSSTEKSTTASTYTKLKEIQISNTGSYRVTFNMKTGFSSTVGYGRVYISRGGSVIQYGTEQIVGPNDNGVYYPFAQDFSLQKGDLVQIYAKSSTNYTYIGTVTLGVNPYIGGTITLQ
jgi:hypothetical protein